MTTDGSKMQEFSSQVASVQDSTVEVDELDLCVVNCLQVDPRASWATVGQVLGIDPVTASRRWQRLSDAGIAWVTGRAAGHTAPESCLAVIELSCSAAETMAIAHRIASLPHVLSLEHTSGPRALSLLAEIRDLSMLSSFLLESLGRTNRALTRLATQARLAQREGEAAQFEAAGAAQLWAARGDAPA